MIRKIRVSTPKDCVSTPRIQEVPDFADAYGDEDSNDAISNDERDKNQNSNIFCDDDDAEDGREHQVNEDPIEEGEVIINEEASNDPFKIYPILNDKIENMAGKGSSSNYTHPPGFSHMKGQEDKHGMENNNTQEEEDATWLNKNDKESVQPKHKEEVSDSVSSGHFKISEVPKTGGSILQLLDDVVKVGQVMGYKMEGCLGKKAKKEWVKELCNKNKVNFLSLQETKMEVMDILCVKLCCGNMAFEYVHSDAVGNSGGILCVWDPICYYKENVTKSDSFKEKHLLWDYLEREIKRWDGEVVTMGDFNEVRHKCERLGSVFNASEANVFNSFIVGSGLAEVVLGEVVLGGSKFTWCHKSGTKMSKLDRFLIFKNLMYTYPNINAITLPRYLSDHCLIFLREISHDYGPIPFKVFHYWFDIDGFNNLVDGIWKGYQSKELNLIRFFIGKLKVLKRKIREWNNSRRSADISLFSKLNLDLESIDEIIDRGDGNDEIMCKRSGIINNLND
nr:RNA-directed DNA polymerase, eukaryota [Tanacetum cinerariifolium]